MISNKSFDANQMMEAIYNSFEILMETMPISNAVLLLGVDRHLNKSVINLLHDQVQKQADQNHKK